MTSQPGSKGIVSSQLITVYFTFSPKCVSLSQFCSYSSVWPEALILLRYLPICLLSKFKLLLNPPSNVKFQIKNLSSQQLFLLMWSHEIVDISLLWNFFKNYFIFFFINIISYLPQGHRSSATELFTLCQNYSFPSVTLHPHQPIWSSLRSEILLFFFILFHSRYGINDSECIKRNFVYSVNYLLILIIRFTLALSQIWNFRKKMWHQLFK